jgi:twinkle protein
MIIPEGIDFNDYISLVGELEAQEIHSPKYWSNEVVALNSGTKLKGHRLPWSKTHEVVRLRPGELSIWAGINGHMKSLMTGNIMLHLARHSRIAIASMEMTPAQTLYRMIRQASGSNSGDIPDQYVSDCNDYLDDNVLIYDQLDMVPTEKILGFVNYCGSVLKCKHIVIDSLSKCGIKNDIDAESEFINRLQFSAKHLGCHIHLVHHVRKPQGGNKYYKPTKFDIKGSGSLTDMVDNCFIVWKNIKRFEELEKKKRGDDFDQDLIDETPDNLLLCEKQRHGEWEGAISLWFHSKTGAFLGDSGGNPIPLPLTYLGEDDARTY